MSAEESKAYGLIDEVLDKRQKAFKSIKKLGLYK